MKTILRFAIPLFALGLLVLLVTPVAGTARPAETRTAAARATVTAPVTPIATQSARFQLTVRKPLGVYAKVDLSEFSNVQKKADHSITPEELEAQLISLYQSLLANPAISGLTIGIHWDLVNPEPPSSSNAYDWTLMDDAFNQVALWNSQNPTQPAKTIQLIPTAGFNSPQWLLDQIPSCDGLFTPATLPPSSCGKVTFVGYAQAEGADSTELPLPWNPAYKSAWQTFLGALNARYGTNPAFVSVAVGGPTAASTEMILPRSGNTPNQTQFGGISPDDMWLKLLAFAYPNQPAYQNSDQAFIDEWDAAIDMYGQVFSGITLVLSPDTGGLPDFSQTYPAPPQTDTLYYNGDCSAPDMDCAAVTTILTHFIDPTVGGDNAKSTQTGGMKAFNPKSDLGISAVKLLAQQTEQLVPMAEILGGEQFDHSFSLNPSQEGCTTASQCSGSISPEQAEYNVLRVFFNGTHAASSFGGTPGSAPLNYLQCYYEDIQYATAHINDPAPVTQTDGTTVNMTAQDMLNLTSQELLQIAEINRAS